MAKKQAKNDPYAICTAQKKKSGMGHDAWKRCVQDIKKEEAVMNFYDRVSLLEKSKKNEKMSNTLPDSPPADEPEDKSDIEGEEELDQQDTEESKKTKKGGIGAANTAGGKDADDEEEVEEDWSDASRDAAAKARQGKGSSDDTDSDDDDSDDEKDDVTGETEDEEEDRLKKDTVAGGPGEGPPRPGYSVKRALKRQRLRRQSEDVLDTDMPDWVKKGEADANAKKLMGKDKDEPEDKGDEPMSRKDKEINRLTNMYGRDRSDWPEASKEALANIPEGKKGEDKDWIQKAVNPAHKGYCTPMTKKTCTPARKALAKRFKKAGRKEKKQGGTGWQGKV